MSAHSDRELTCVDCGQAFTWTVGEQEFFQEKGFPDPPKRCQECRQARKAEREARGQHGRPERGGMR